jgi:hypothetical protein
MSCNSSNRNKIVLNVITFQKIERKDKVFPSDNMDIIALEISLKSADQLGLKE